MMMDIGTAISAVQREQSVMRDRAFDEARRRRAALFTRYAELGPLYEEAEGVYADALARGIRVPAEAAGVMAKAEAEYERLSGLLDEALARRGVDKADLLPRFACPICEDRGYVTEPRYARCACFERRLLELTDPGGKREQHTFEGFDASVFPETKVAENLTQRSLMLRARMLCEGYADRYPNDKFRNVVITGNSGLGKTFLLDCVVERARSRGISVLSVSAFGLQRMMRDYHMGKDTAALDGVMTASLLAVDDLGAEPVMENITLVYLTNLLNERAANKLGMIVTTNLTLGEFKQVYSERVFSRLFDTRHSAVLSLAGSDVRLGILS